MASPTYFVLARFPGYRRPGSDRDWFAVGVTRSEMAARTLGAVYWGLAAPDDDEYPAEVRVRSEDELRREEGEAAVAAALADLAWLAGAPRVALVPTPAPALTRACPLPTRSAWHERA